MVNPTVRGSIALVLAAVLVLTGYFYGKHISDLEYLLKDTDRSLRYSNTQLAEANTALSALSAASVQLADAQTKYSKGVQSDQALLASTLASIHTGSARLSIGIKSLASSKAGDSSGTAGSAGEIRAELSDEAVDFLTSEASRANKVVRALQLCQEVLVKQQEVNK